MSTLDKRMTHGYEDDFPSYLAGNLDPHQHTTQADYVALVEFEIDLYEEDEESDIANDSQLRYCKAYVKRYRRH